MFRDENNGWVLRCRRENVRWRLVVEVRASADDGELEGRGAAAAAARAGGAPVRPALHRQRGLPARHRHRARRRLRPSGHPPHEER